MKQAQNQNELHTLSTVLLSNLDETVFFSKLSGFFHADSQEYKVQVFESLPDGSTRLIAENGHAVEGSQILAKGQGLSGYVTRMRRAYFSNSVKRDPIAAQIAKDESVETELCFPILSEGVVLGTINIQSKATQFSDKDLKHCQEILSQLESPIRNMRILVMAKALNRELMQKLENSQKNGVIETQNTQGQQTEERINLVGISKSFLDVIQVAKKVAVHDFPVLLQGEAGSGKKILARKIHFWSHRRSHKYVIVHCNSLNEAQLEAELFGKKNVQGSLRDAHGGTLILDGINSLSINLQNKLLRTMLTGEVVSSDGSEKALVNVRIIALSQISLQDAVERGEFSKDLFIRLNTVAMRMPSLKERKEDIRGLAEHFLNSDKSSDKAKMITAAALDKLSLYHFPGNIEELKNMMNTISTVVEGQIVDINHLPELKTQVVETKAEPVIVKFNEMTLFDLEKKHIIDTLEHLNGNKTRAAKALGITVKTLYNKLHSYGLITSAEVQ